jgi:potassium efflux system protein
VAPSVAGLVRPETVALRKAAAQTQLEALERLLLSPEEAEALRATLEQHLKVLTALEAAFQKRTAYAAQLGSLPRQVEALNAERRALAAHPPQRFAEVTEQLRLDHEAQLQATRAELDGLRKELTAGELRLANIPKDIEQRLTDLAQSEKDILTARNDATKATEQKSLLQAHAELLDLRQQLQQAEMDMLEAEREWLTKQGPLRDAQLGLAQTRYAVLQQELEAIKTALGKVISKESTELASSEEEIARQLQQTTDPTEVMLLKVQLETIKLRQSIADSRQQLSAIGDQVSEQEKRNEREKQEAAHLASLVEKYASGERIAQRLQAAFTRLRREQARHGAASVRTMEVDLDRLSDQELDLEEQLYDFDNRADMRLRDLTLALQTLTPAQREVQFAKVRKVVDEQKAALREQQQTLRALVQEQTKLLTLRRGYTRLLEEGDQFVLTKLFWLRDGQMLGERVLQDAGTGAMVTAKRLEATFRAELSLLPHGQQGTVRFWLLVVFIGVGLPLVAVWATTRLRHLVASLLARDMQHGLVGTRGGVALLLVVQTGIWPAYIALVAWAWPHVIMAGRSVLNLELPLMVSFQLSALVLWGGVLGRALCRYQVWWQPSGGIVPEAHQEIQQRIEVCQELQRTIAVACVATLLLLVPRYILLNAPGGPEAVTGSLALARLCFTAFQVVPLVMVGIVCRRGSRLMTAVLARSRQVHGLLWRHWPLLYLVLLAAMSTALVLDVLGYHYASRTLWLRLGQALLVILVLVWIDHQIKALIDRLALQQPPQGRRAFEPLPPNLWALLEKGRPFIRIGLVLSGLLVLEHVYGIRQGLLGLLDSISLLEVGQNRDGQILWLTLQDVVEAGLILTSIVVFVRHLPGICAALLFPHVRWDAGVRYAFLMLGRYVLIFLALWWSLSVVHMSWSSIQWIVAAVSVGVGFGLQEIVSNFMSGLILLLERPVRVDDIVTVGDQSGVVKRITIRATAIQNADNQTVLIPNKEFIVQRVTNWTLGDTHVRLVLSVGVAYGSDLDLVKRLLTETVSSHPRVLTTPAPMVLLHAFGDHALQWEISCFVPRPQDRPTTAHDLLLQIEQTFHQQGIVMPFPQQDIHLRSADAALVIQSQGNGYSGVAAHAEQTARGVQ